MSMNGTMVSTTLLRLLRGLVSLPSGKKRSGDKKRRRKESSDGNADARASTVGIETVFRYLDGDGDGKIHPSDLQRSAAAAGPHLALSDSEAELAAEIMDADGDGLAGLEGFARAVGGRGLEEEDEEELREAFAVYVVAAGRWEGSITPKSLRAALAKLGEAWSLEECRTMVRTYDVNGDGVINFDEFLLMMVA